MHMICGLHLDVVTVCRHQAAVPDMAIAAPVLMEAFDHDDIPCLDAPHGPEHAAGIEVFSALQVTCVSGWLSRLMHAEACRHQVAVSHMAPIASASVLASSPKTGFLPGKHCQPLEVGIADYIIQEACTVKMHCSTRPL